MRGLQPSAIKPTQPRYLLARLCVPRVGDGPCAPTFSVLTLGDNQYETGAPSGWSSFDITWGPLNPDWDQVLYPDNVNSPREFIIGTGGKNHTTPTRIPPNPIQPNLELWNSDTFRSAEADIA